MHRVFRLLLLLLLACVVWESSVEAQPRLRSGTAFILPDEAQTAAFGVKNPSLLSGTPLVAPEPGPGGLPLGVLQQSFSGGLNPLTIFVPLAGALVLTTIVSAIVSIVSLSAKWTFETRRFWAILAFSSGFTTATSSLILISVALAAPWLWPILGGTFLVGTAAFVLGLVSFSRAHSKNTRDHKHPIIPKSKSQVSIDFPAHPLSLPVVSTSAISFAF